MKVKAKERGYYKQIREVGDEFDIPKKIFSSRWMEDLSRKPGGRGNPSSSSRE